MNNTLIIPNHSNKHKGGESRTFHCGRTDVFSFASAESVTGWI